MSQHEEFKKAERAFKVKDELGMENGTHPPRCWRMYVDTAKLQFPLLWHKLKFWNQLSKVEVFNNLTVEKTNR